MLSRAGLRLEVDLRHTTAMGVAELTGRLPRQIAAFARILHLARVWRPKAALLVDVPDFNLPLGARLRRLGVQVLGYVAPQFWAWRAGRLRIIGRCYDRLACILPFEEGPLRRHGVDALFVGHPAAEVDPLRPGEVRLEQYSGGAFSHNGLEEGRRCVALLPGSRPAEVARLLEPMLRAAARLRRRDPSLRVVLAQAASLVLGKNFPEIPDWVQVVTSDDTPRHGRAVLSLADVAAVASGTATLEAALQGTPQVVAYKLAWPSFCVAKLLVRSRFVALPNILVNSPVVPELIQSKMTVDALTAHLSELLDNEPAAAAQRRALLPLRSMLRGPGATRATASLLAEMIQR